MSVHGCTIVFYHYVRDVERTPFPGIKALSVADFAAQVDWLQARYEIIDGATFERAVSARIGFDRPTALLTTCVSRRFDGLPAPPAHRSRRTSGPHLFHAPHNPEIRRPFSVAARSEAKRLGS